MKHWLTVSEAAEYYCTSARFIHYLITGRGNKPPALTKIRLIPYGSKTMYLVNYSELSKLLGK